MTYQLPYRDELGFCNVLISALGGDGANTSAKLLFKIGCQHFGLDGGYDAKYGSEKKGTATDVSVRFCQVGAPVRQSGPTARPHYLVVYHTDLIAPLELFRGLQPGATCIVNTHQAPEQVREQLRLPYGRVVCLDASRIARDTASRLNMPLLAALCHEMKFPDDEAKRLIAAQWPRNAERNLAAYDRAVTSAVTADFGNEDRFEALPPMVQRGPLGWTNVLNGGAIDALTHSTRGRDNRVASRGRVPQFDVASCTSCGICLTVCSDPGGLLWQGGKMTGIDPAFCKGCIRCVEVCPTNKKGHALSVPDDALVD